MKLEKAEIFYSQPLANKYLLNYPQVAHLYDYNPYLDSSYRQRLVDVSDCSGFKRQQLCRALLLYNGHLGAGEKTVQNISRLAENAAVVLTGQQPGIFTGPLYTIYKALAACMLAKKLTLTLHHPVVPIFWVGSEDHDFLEINHVNVPSATGPVTLTLPYPVDGRPSVGTIPLLPEVKQLLQQLQHYCHGDKQQLLGQQMLAIIEKSTNLSDWFARLLSWLFNDFGLIMVDSMLPEIRRLEADFFYQAIANNVAVEQAFKAGYNKVAAMDIKPQVEHCPGRANLFIYHRQQRTALYRDKGGYRSRDGKIRYSPQELLSLADTSPERLSVNVILKPVATEMIFPLLAYVGGPGEIGYYGLCKPLYHLFGRKMPVIYPRPSVTLIEPRAMKYLNKYRLSPAQFTSNPQKCVANFLHNTQSININEPFAQFNADLTILHKKLFCQLNKLPADIAGLEQENLHSLIKKVNQLQAKVTQRHRKAHQTELRQLNWLQHQLTPSGGQERVYNIMPYLAKYGVELINKLGELPLLEGNEHNLVYL
ncbi:bacillithiol biosynthesis cysteine-adding enzyme BshC [Peptococcaceae bacterium 1198_IL3148]